MEEEEEEEEGEEGGGDSAELSEVWIFILMPHI